MEDGEGPRVVSKKLNLGFDNPNLLGILVAIFIVILTLIGFSLYKRSKTKKNGILLFGVCDAGKTVIYTQLVYGKFINTYTSMKENVEDYVAGNFSFRLIDIPGHERLRGRFFDRFKSLTRGLVFVIDSVTVQKDIRDVAEYLYSCLSDNVIMSNMPPLLILCNKQDEATAKSKDVIKILLEKEINILRTTKTNQLESLENTANNIFLGKKGKDFEFSHLSPMRIEFAECSAKSEENEKGPNLNVLEEWMLTIV